jgi:hypothetical protein
MPLISRDIKLCAQKVEPQISRESLAVRGRASWASISVGCSDGTHRG